MLVLLASVIIDFTTKLVTYGGAVVSVYQSPIITLLLKLSIGKSVEGQFDLTVLDQFVVPAICMSSICNSLICQGTIITRPDHVVASKPLISLLQSPFL
jgi:hypothetical protein